MSPQPQQPQQTLAQPQGPRTRSQAILQETVARLSQQSPPPYSPMQHGADSESGIEEDEQSPPPPKIQITINGATTVHGSNNIVALPPVDGNKLAGALIAALAAHMNATGAGRPADITIQLNCGVNVVGDRNVVSPGPAGLRLRALQGQGVGAASANANVGVRPQGAMAPLRVPLATLQQVNLKRKADDQNEEQRDAKRSAPTAVKAESGEAE